MRKGAPSETGNSSFIFPMLWCRKVLILTVRYEECRRRQRNFYNACSLVSQQTALLKLNGEAEKRHSFSRFKFIVTMYFFSFHFQMHFSLLAAMGPASTLIRSTNECLAKLPWLPSVEKLMCSVPSTVLPNHLFHEKRWDPPCSWTIIQAEDLWGESFRSFRHLYPHDHVAAARFYLLSFLSNDVVYPYFFSSFPFYQKQIYGLVCTQSAMNESSAMKTSEGSRDSSSFSS